MEFRDAIDAHVNWKVRLRLLMAGQEKIDATVAAKDNECALGKWIYGEGSRALAKDPETLEDLRKAHAAFHQTAGTAVRAIQSGDPARAEAMLEADGEISERSFDVVSRIRKIQSILGQAAAVS